MKNLILNFIVIFLSLGAFAQDVATEAELPGIAISPGITLHIISPENVRLAEVSSPSLKVILPEKNIIQVKVSPDSAGKIPVFDKPAVLTIVADHFLTQYRLFPSSGPVVTRVFVSASDMKPFETNASLLSQKEMKEIAFSLVKRKPSALRSSMASGLKGQINQIITTGDYLFLDLSWQNRTGLKYDTESVRFLLEDKKVRKARNQQSLPIVPIFSLYPDRTFNHRFRNIYVIPKMSFAATKVLRIELAEKQISGRNLSFTLKHRDILEADTW